MSRQVEDLLADGWTGGRAGGGLRAVVCRFAGEGEGEAIGRLLGYLKEVLACHLSGGVWLG